MNTSADEFVRGGGGSPPSIGLTSSVLPEVQTPLEEQNSDTGVSTRNAPLRTIKRPPKPETIPHWYVIRCTYGRGQKAKKLFSKEGFDVYCPTITTCKNIDGKIVKVTESRLPNLLFAYGSFEQLKVYVHANGEDTKYLRFYFSYHHDRPKEPLIISNREMKMFMAICEADADDKHIEPFVVEKFKEGQRVRVKDGPFAGVEGTVHRYKGQQRVGFVIKSLATAATAYVPSAFLEKITE